MLPQMRKMILAIHIMAFLLQGVVQGHLRVTYKSNFFTNNNYYLLKHLWVPHLTLDPDIYTAVLHSLLYYTKYNQTSRHEFRHSNNEHQRLYHKCMVHLSISTYTKVEFPTSRTAREMFNEIRGSSPNTTKQIISIDAPILESVRISESILVVSVLIW